MIIRKEDNLYIVYIFSNFINDIDIFDYNDITFLFKRIFSLLKEKYNVIVSGRAIMQIYPDTDYHFFITADIDERVKRKAIQYNGKVDLEELKEHILKRDKLNYVFQSLSIISIAPS